MNLADALPQDELMLARLTASKLAKVMHGLISVGTASLGMESPTEFLRDRDKTPLGFLEVLGCIGVKPGHADKVPALREHVKELAEATSRFYRRFLELANWKRMSSDEVDAAVARLGDCYAQLCRRLGEFCSILGMEADFTQQAVQDSQYVGAFFQSPVTPNRS